jgi:prophage DNA circulation protein
MSRTNCAIGKDYVPASFKGVGFLCTDAGIEGGRRGAEGEFPFGEDTQYADLGRKIRVYHLTAVFREDDHVSDSQALFEACQSPGPGLLVHPTRGAAMVACRSVKLKDAIEDKAGESTAELEFVEANEGIGGIAGLLFGIISTGLNAASSASFQRDYQPTLVAQPWRADVIDTAQLVVHTTATVAHQVLPPDAPMQDRRDVLKMEEVANDDGLAASAKNVDRALTAGFAIIDHDVSDADKEFRLMKKLANVAGKTSALPEGVAVKSEEAVFSRQRVLAAIGMAQAAMARKYAYTDQALTAMDQVLVVLNDEAHAAYAACDNTLFLELRKYATQFEQMMNDLAYRLPGLIIVDFMGGVHPLVASYAIYKDAKRHRELEQRNILDANGRMKPLVAGIAPT